MTSLKNKFKIDIKAQGWYVGMIKVNYKKRILS